MFTHTIRPRYGECDMQGIVFNARWLDYFDDACTRFFEHLGYEPKQTFMEGGPFDFTVAKAVLEFRGPARFDDEVRIEVRPARLGNSSFDLAFTATVDGRPACQGTTTYVFVEPGTLESRPIPPDVRERMQKAAS
jgi:acyl-CoA thioester hydrolase